MELESKRQVQKIRTPLLACLGRSAAPDQQSMAALALGRLGAKHPQWVDAEGLSASLVPMLDDADRIVRASAALAVGMLKLQAGAEKLCLLWRNDPISHVRDAALTAMKSVGGPLIEDKLRIEKVLSTKGVESLDALLP